MRKVLQVTLRSLEKYKFLDQMFETWKGFVFSWTLIFAFLLQLSGKKKLWKYIKEWEKKWKKPKDLSRQWTYSIFIVFWKGKRKISWNCMTVVKEIMFIHTMYSAIHLYWHSIHRPIFKFLNESISYLSLTSPL